MHVLSLLFDIPLCVLMTLIEFLLVASGFCMVPVGVFMVIFGHSKFGNKQTICSAKYPVM